MKWHQLTTKRGFSENRQYHSFLCYSAATCYLSLHQPPSETLRYSNKTWNYQIMPWSCLSGRPPTIMILKSHSKPVDKSSSFRPKINFIKIAPEKGPSRVGKLTNSYNLKKINPKLAKEWHPTKNGNLTPKDVTPSSGQKVWWICDNRGHKGHWWWHRQGCR